LENKRIFWERENRAGASEKTLKGRKMREGGGGEKYIFE